VERTEETVKGFCFLGLSGSFLKGFQPSYSSGYSLPFRTPASTLTNPIDLDSAMELREV
jgi:hypothetical protein